MSVSRRSRRQAAATAIARTAAVAAALCGHSSSRSCGHSLHSLERGSPLRSAPLVQCPRASALLFRLVSLITPSDEGSGLAYLGHSSLPSFAALCPPRPSLAHQVSLTPVSRSLSLSHTQRHTHGFDRPLALFSHLPLSLSLSFSPNLSSSLFATAVLSCSQPSAAASIPLLPRRAPSTLASRCSPAHRDVAAAPKMFDALQCLTSYNACLTSYNA
eukprot:2198981-Pleurochrysis_carterae.AAC.1